MEGKRIGKHEVRFEEQDTVYVRVVGDVTPRELDEIFSLLQAYGEGRDRQYWLIEMAEAGTMSAESRRCASAWAPRLRIGGVAMFHIGFEQRIIANMLTHVYRLIGSLTYPVKMFDDEASARAWLESQRRRAGGASRTD